MTSASVIFFALCVTRVQLQQTTEQVLTDSSVTDQLGTSLLSPDDTSSSREHVSVIVTGTGGVHTLTTDSDRNRGELSAKYTTEALSFVANSVADESSSSSSAPVIVSSTDSVGTAQYISSADNSGTDESTDVPSAAVVASSKDNVGPTQSISSTGNSTAGDSHDVPSTSLTTSAKGMLDTTQSSLSYPTTKETRGYPLTSIAMSDNITDGKEADLSSFNETTVTPGVVLVSDEPITERSAAGFETITDGTFSANETNHTAANDTNTNTNAKPTEDTLHKTDYSIPIRSTHTVSTEMPITDDGFQTLETSTSYSDTTSGSGLDREEANNYTLTEGTEVTETAEEASNVTTSAIFNAEEFSTRTMTEGESVTDDAEVSTLSEGELYINATSAADLPISESSTDNTTQEAISAILSETGGTDITTDAISGTAWADIDHDKSTSSIVDVTESITDTTPSLQKDIFFDKAKPSTMKKAEPEPTTETVTKKATYHKPTKDDTNVIKFVPEVMEVTAVVPSPSTWSPPLYVTLIMKISVEEFRTKQKVLRADICRLMIEEFDDIDMSEKQVVILAQGISTDKDKREQKTERLKRSSENSEVQVYIEDGKGYYSYSLTKQLMGLFVDRGLGAFKGTGWQELIVDMKFHGSKGIENMSVEDSNESWQPHVGILVAIVIGVIAATVVLAFIILQLVIFKRRRRIKKMRHSYDNRYSMDTLQALNLDNIQLTSIRMTNNRWGAYINPALVIDDKDTGSNPLSFTALSNFVKDERAIEEEFVMLPNYVAKMADIPAGAEDKNRYANVIPIPETRVPLMTVTEKNPAAGYINANFVRGYLCAPHSYIATQAPLKNTVEDFWRMVFEQKSQAILMLTALEENGSPRCVEYWPNTDGGDMKRRFGEFEVTLLKRDIRHEWITSVLRLRHLSKTTNQYLEVHHFWLTSWPDVGLPDSKTLLGYLIHARPYMEQSIGPTVVHCSSGTGRTGVVLAVDIQMLSYDDSKLVDVLSCVCGLRQDRPGLVQTKEQYKLIYRAVFEYAQALNSVSGNPSRASSYNSIQIVH